MSIDWALIDGATEAATTEEGQSAEVVGANRPPEWSDGFRRFCLVAIGPVSQTGPISEQALKDGDLFALPTNEEHPPDGLVTAAKALGLRCVAIYPDRLDGYGYHGTNRPLDDEVVPSGITGNARHGGNGHDRTFYLDATNPKSLSAAHNLAGDDPLGSDAHVYIVRPIGKGTADNWAGRSGIREHVGNLAIIGEVMPEGDFLDVLDSHRSAGSDSR